MALLLHSREEQQAKRDRHINCYPLQSEVDPKNWTTG